LQIYVEKGNNVMDEFVTNSKTKNVQEGEPIVLEETECTKLFFIPTITDKGVRGYIKRYKKQKTSKWDDILVLKPHTQSYNTCHSIELSTEVLNILVEKHQQLSVLPPTGYGTQHHLIASNRDDKFSSFVECLKNNENLQKFINQNSDITSHIAKAYDITKRKGIIEEFKKRLLDDTISETTGDNSWQKWISRNSWLFGANYLPPIEKAKINVCGIMPDFIFPTRDRFIDILAL
jgi:hypothetical protein